jgi:hypothetical protein
MEFRASEGRGFSSAVPTPANEVVENVVARFAVGLKPRPSKSASQPFFISLLVDDWVNAMRSITVPIVRQLGGLQRLCSPAQ